MSNPFVKFFKALGRGFSKLGHLLAGISHLFTEAQLDFALDVVHAAVDKFPGNANRKTWATHMVMTELHLPEHLANLLVELAVTQIKHREDQLFQRLDDALDGKDEFPNVQPVEGVVAPNPQHGADLTEALDSALSIAPGVFPDEMPGDFPVEEMPEPPPVDMPAANEPVSEPMTAPAPATAPRTAAKRK